MICMPIPMAEHDQNFMLHLNSLIFYMRKGVVSLMMPYASCDTVNGII